MPRFAALFLFCLLTSGCCQLFSKEDPQPARPNVTSTWTEQTDSFGVRTIGFFVMNKGEAIDNGRLGVKVIDVLPMECECMSCEPTYPRVKIAFYRPSDNKVLCEGDFFKGSASLEITAKCDPGMGISHLAINAINTKDKWVSFDLRK
jgi:hypothetical protein